MGLYGDMRSMYGSQYQTCLYHGTILFFGKAASPFFGKLRVGYVELLHTLTQRCALRLVACSAAGRSSRIFIQRIRGLVLACTYTPAVECLTENYMRTAQQR